MRRRLIGTAVGAVLAVGVGVAGIPLRSWSSKAQAGDVVLAVGHPLGLAGSVTEGIISATGRAVIEPTTASMTAAKTASKRTADFMTSSL